MKARKKDHHDKRESYRSYFKEYRDKREKVQKDRSAQPARKKRKGSAAASAEAAVRPLPEDLESQASLAPWCPAGGHIWKSTRGQAWCIHYPPFPRRSFSWAAKGHRVAAREALHLLWEQHQMTTGVACPYSALAPQGAAQHG